MIVFLSFSCSASLFSEETKYYFHHPENNFGSDLIFNPASLFLNGTFDILRNNGRPKNIYKIPYRTGVDNVIENLTHPVQNIEKYGWTNFVENEVFNTSLNPDKMQFLPNYTLHLIGNSMQYIKLAEWYQHHQYPYPYLLSLATTLGYQFMNEVIENWDYRGANVDPIADMLIFNPVGFLLFSTDWGKEFFSEQFPIYDWSGQPYYNPGNGFMENAGQQYSAKIQFRSASRTSFFIHWGVFAALGLSYRMKNDCSLSVSYGSISYHLNDHRDGAARIVTSLLKSGVGIFWDKNNSLLASAMISVDGKQIKLETFPGLLAWRNIRPGFFVGKNSQGNLQLGMSVSYSPLGILTEFNP